MTQLRLNTSALVALSCLLACTSGCTTSLFRAETWSGLMQKPDILEHGTELRVISKFSASLNENKEAEFRRTVSTRFENSALRAPDSFRDLEILKLPKGELEIVESSEVEAGRCETVAREKTGTTKYQLILVKGPVKGRWVIDDVMLRQQKKGTRSTKSAVELMDLLITLREFLGIWEKGSRDEVLQAVSTEMASSLDALPESWRVYLTEEILAEYSPDMARRPEIQMNDTDAVGKLPAKNGYFLVKVAREEDRWKVSDIEHRNSLRNSRGDHHPGSVLRQARAILAVTSFLDAYNHEDLEQLQAVSEPRFFDSSLRIGDLSTIHLPPAEHAPDNVQIQSFAGKLTVIMPGPDHVVRMDLESADTSTHTTSEKMELADVEKDFLVSDVTLYDQRSQKQRSLRAAFTAPARAMLFIAALHEHDLPILRQVSSAQLNEGIWSRIDQDWLAEFPLDAIPGGHLELIETNSTGSATELQFQSDEGRLCSIIMEDENGSLVVTDLQYPGADLAVASLKTQLLVSVPIIDFARAWQAEDIDTVRKMTSSDFNRLVWSNLRKLPEELNNLPQLLKQPVHSVRQSPQTAVVELGTRNTTTVTLAREGGAWVIDEISCTMKDKTVMHVRKSLREGIAARFLGRPADSVRQASLQTADNTENAGGVVHAVGKAPAPRLRGNLSLPSSGSAKPASRPAASTAGGLDLTEEPAPRKPAAKTQQTKKSSPAASISSDELLSSEDLTDSDILPDSEENAATLNEENSTGDLNFGPRPKTSDKTSRKSAMPADRPVAIPLE
ncbi:MAG: DUF3828 domain-containing protein [Planctomycetaceae bacterium]